MLLAAYLLLLYIMQAFHSSLPPHKLVRLQSDTAAKWCTVTAALQVWVCPHSCYTVSRILRSTMSLTALLPRLDSFTVSLFFPFLVEMSDILYKTDYFLVLPAHLFFCLCLLFQQYISYYCLFPLFSFTSSIPVFSRDCSVLFSRPLSVFHSAFPFIPFCALACSGCCSTVADPRCNTHNAPGPSPCIERNPIPGEECGRPRGRPNRGTNQLVIQQIVYLQVILSDTWGVIRSVDSI